MSAATQFSIDAAATGHVFRDYFTSGGLQRVAHIASAHNSLFVMDRASGQLVIQRDGQEVFHTDIMNITALVAATPALRFTELANSLTT